MLILRGADQYGSGAWGAPRGGRKHRGIDLACCKDAQVYAPISGTVTKLGYPYGAEAKRHLRYVEVTDSEGHRHRVMYVLPVVKLGDSVDKDVTEIGIAQGLTDVYPGIRDHVHYEIIDKQGRYIDPMGWL